MIYLKRVALLICFLTSSLYSSAQYFDGGLDFTGYLGIEPGEYTSGILGADAGLGKYFSVGMGFRYLISAPELLMNTPPNGPIVVATNTPFLDNLGFSLRADIHAYNIFNLNKSDILVGYHRFNGANGVHLEYRKFLNEFLGFYARPRYNFESPRRSTDSESMLMDTQFFIQVGFLFKTLSGDSYEVDW